MTSFCRDACIICDIDGFTGRNNSNVAGQAPPGFCTSFVHHMQWIGFIAGTTNLTLEVRVSNCNSNQGLEIGLYRSLDCNTFSRVSDCDTDIQPGEVRVFTNTVPLVVGQYYYFVMDGSDNDICDWTIKVTSGSTKVAPLEIAPQINIPNEVCQMDSFYLSTPGITGATIYQWVIEGTQNRFGLDVPYVFEQPGTYNICLEASNVCDKAPVVCKKIEVKPIKTEVISQQLCFGECFHFEGKKYCQSGAYDVYYQASNGCDSILTLDLLFSDKIDSKSTIEICDGDTLRLNGQNFTKAGKYKTVLLNADGCEVNLEFNLIVLNCVIESVYATTDVLCNGDNTGIFELSIFNGIPPFIYNAYKVENTSITYSGIVQNLNQISTINGLDAGSYVVKIEDKFGSKNIVNFTIKQNEAIEVKKIVSAYDTFQLRCFYSDDGYFKLLPSGGKPPYAFDHIFTGSKADSIGQLKSGTYQSRIIDALGCIKEVTTILKAPDSLQMDVSFKNPGCMGLNTGEVNVLNTVGGVLPYQYYLNNLPSSKDGQFKNLTGGYYALVVKDDHDCFLKVADDLVAAEIPDISLDQVAFETELGDSITLSAQTNLGKQTVFWSPSDKMECNSCLETKVLPVNSQLYTITVISKDSCTTTANVRVKVNKNRSFVISNIFTPNADNVNEKIKYWAGKDVESILYYNLYDRWGNLIYAQKNLKTGLQEIDWNATFKGQKLQPGVYSWIIDVLYIDQAQIKYHGTMTIVE